MNVWLLKPKLKYNNMSEWNPNLPEVELPKKNKPHRKWKPKRQPKKRGRKKLIRAFEATTFGSSLKLNAPLEYDMIMEITVNGAPDADLIEQISYASMNPYFRGKIFRRLLIQYRQNGCTQLRPVLPPSPEKKMRALNQRRRQMYGL